MDLSAGGGGRAGRARLCSVWQRYFEKCADIAAREVDRHDLCECPIACEGVDFVPEVTSAHLHADGLVALLDATERERRRARREWGETAGRADAPEEPPILVKLRRKALKADEIRSRVNRRQIARSGNAMVVDLSIKRFTEMYDVSSRLILMDRPLATIGTTKSWTK